MRARQFESYKLNAYVRGDTAWIVGDWQGRRPRKFSGEFAINVPREITLVKIETEGGNIDTSGVAGRVEAQSGGGSMHLDDIGGGAHAETGGGSIDVGTINGRYWTAHWWRIDQGPPCQWNDHRGNRRRQHRDCFRDAGSQH